MAVPTWARLNLPATQYALALPAGGVRGPARPNGGRAPVTGGREHDGEIEIKHTATPPNQAWQGTIYSLRLDPVVRFLDETDAPADGWFEIGRIAIY
jgi:hypothetical protein